MFTFDLMEHIHILILECQVSLHDIARMLHMSSILHQKEVINVMCMIQKKLIMASNQFYIHITHDKVIV